MPSIWLTYHGKSSPHTHQQFVNFHLWDVFPFLLEGNTQLAIVCRKWMSVTYCPIYWGQSRGICWPIKHMDFPLFTYPLLMRVTWGLAVSCCKWCCSVERRVVRSGAVSHGAIWQHSGYQHRHTVVCDVHGIFRPKPVRLHRRVPPCLWWWYKHSAPFAAPHTLQPGHLLYGVGNITCRWSWHSSIMLGSSGCASGTMGFAVIVEQGWDIINNSIL